MKNCPINQNILDQINKKLNIVGYLKLHDEDFGILKKEFEEEIYHDLLNRLEIFYVLELTDVNVFYRENLREICEIAKKIIWHISTIRNLESKRDQDVRSRRVFNHHNPNDEEVEILRDKHLNDQHGYSKVVMPSFSSLHDYAYRVSNHNSAEIVEPYQTKIAAETVKLNPLLNEIKEKISAFSGINANISSEVVEKGYNIRDWVDHSRFKSGDWYTIGENYYQKQIYLKAKLCYEEEIKFTPNHANAIFSLGWLYEKGQGIKQNHEVAAKYYFELAKIYDKHGPHEAALKFYLEGARLNHINCLKEFMMSRVSEVHNYQISEIIENVLEKAVIDNNQQGILELFELGVKLNDKFYKPLHAAVESKNVDILKLLLKSNVNINAMNKDGLTALYIALTLSLPASPHDEEKIILNIVEQLLLSEASLDAGKKDNTPQDLYNKHVGNSDVFNRPIWRLITKYKKDPEKWIKDKKEVNAPEKQIIESHDNSWSIFSGNTNKQTINNVRSNSIIQIQINI